MEVPTIKQYMTLYNYNIDFFLYSLFLYFLVNPLFNFVFINNLILRIVSETQ